MPPSFRRLRWLAAGRWGPPRRPNHEPEMVTTSRGSAWPRSGNQKHTRTTRRAHRHRYTRLLNHLLLLRLEPHRALTPIHHLPRRRDRNPPLFANPEDRTGRPWNGRPR